MRFLTLKAFLGSAVVTVLVVSLPVFGTLKTANTFAVFYAKSNRRTHQAQGGVAGTAFFTSAHHAMTAFHVLKKSSFQVESPDEAVQIWLVRENRTAIEIFPSELVERPELDQTEIDFGQLAVAQKDEVFSLSSNFAGLKSGLEPSLLQNEVFSTDGFVGSSAGPRLEWTADGLRVTEVPFLNRIHAEGRLIRRAQVELKATDVQLHNVGCFQVQFTPRVGLSGGPLIYRGQVVGINSFADSSKNSTWAVQL